jgi:hypothetical protein
MELFLLKDEVPEGLKANGNGNPKEINKVLQVKSANHY